jgi:hypothetical protein
MTEFLSSLKADLLDRRLLPLVAVVALALVAAVAYAALGGGSSAETPAGAIPSGPSHVASGLSVSQTTPETAVAETTGGGSTQHRGVAHNPFTPLPEVKAKTASTTTTTPASTAPSSSTGSSGSSSPSSGAGSGSSTPVAPEAPTPAKPSAPAKPKTVYHVAVLFGQLPDTTTPLTPYVDLKLLTPLPSPTQPLIVFRGVTAGGKSATFTLVGEAILHGEGACLPSASQCEAIDLQPGKSEQLEYLPAGGQTITYELKVVSIASSKASSSAVKNVLSSESKAGRALLRRDRLTAIPFLSYAAEEAGVLVFAPHHAHAAAHGRRGR